MEKVKQVKKVFAALLAVVMVMGVAPTVLADVGGTGGGPMDFLAPISISNVISSEDAGWPFEITLTEIERAFLEELIEEFDGYDWDDFLYQFEIRRVQVDAPAKLEIIGDSQFNYCYVRGFLSNGSVIIDTRLKENEDWRLDTLADGSSFTMPAQAQAGDVMAIAFQYMPAAQGTIYMIEIVGDGTPVQSAPANDIAVTINGTAVNFTGTQPTIVDGRTLVPVRGVFETLGFDVSWNPDLRQATLERENDTIVITLDSETFTTNGVNHTLDVPAQVIGGSTMLPIRAVLESVGYSLDWDANTRTVIISTN